MTTEVAEPVRAEQAVVAPRERFRYPIELVVTPAFFVLLVSAIAAVWVYTPTDSTFNRILERELLIRRFIEHISMTFWSTLVVLAVAVPLGVFVTRQGFKKFAPPILTFANAGQSIPAFGLLVLFGGWLGFSQRTAIWALALVSLLPVLRNTMVGIQQVDQPVIEAGRGMGLSKWQALFSIELPLAVPVILAGVRTALVINVGTAALAFLIGGGGLGEAISSGIQLRRDSAVFIAAGLVATLALVIDFLAALAERYLRPKGV